MSELDDFERAAQVIKEDRAAQIAEDNAVMRDKPKWLVLKDMKDNNLNHPLIFEGDEAALKEFLGMNFGASGFSVWPLEGEKRYTVTTKTSVEIVSE